ncbi:MAG TPA: wax ester/triacylglycerol synthase family O-acyltransferase [Acidimicrobiales bacterium]|nr:wax ester/triacylglycerol synthase family O-acyltransferase [Acidimicrobiales bacterium]
MDRMSPLDTSFLHIEDSDRAVSLHIGSIGIFEGPPPSHDALAHTMEQRLAQVPRCRQRVEFVPFGLERPLWVDDEDFSVDYHLRRTALPAPAGTAELRRLVGRLMSQRLDRTKPLWEMWVVEGLADQQWALVTKVHHCMVDGVSGAEILAVLLDVTPDPPEVEAPPWVPSRTPSRRDLVLGAARDLSFDSYERVRLLSAQLRRPSRVLEQVRGLLPGLLSLGGVATSASTGGLTGPITPHREYAWADASLDDVKQIRRALGGTVNDVVLAAVAGGFRHLLVERGEDVRADRVVRTLVPVSVRATRPDGAATHDGSFDNRISAMFAELPVGLVDPVERLGAITAQLAGLKESGQAVAGEALTALTGFAPPALLALGMRVAARAVQGSGTVHTVTTNVPGPQLPLYSCGRRMLRAYPYVPIAAPLRTGVAIFSYDGMVTFGVTGDHEVSRDVDVLATGIELTLSALLSAATPKKPKKKAATGKGGA